MAQDIIAETDIWVDDAGKVVRGDPPDAGIKLASKGSVISPKIAKRYNLEGSKAKAAVPSPSTTVLKKPVK